MPFRHDRLELGTQMNLSDLLLFTSGICHGDEDRAQTSPISRCVLAYRRGLHIFLVAWTPEHPPESSGTFPVAAEIYE